MAWDFSTEPEFEQQLEWMRGFVAEEIEPLDLVFRDPAAHVDPRSAAARVMAPLKEEVKKRGLWACHMGHELGGRGLVGSIGMDRDLMQDFVEGVSSPELNRLEDLAAMFERGEFDLVALGRVLLADPNWLEKVEQRRTEELIPYDRAKALEQYELS